VYSSLTLKSLKLVR